MRAVASHIKNKASDPAVVAVDECAHFAVPILSGHLGGANDLARRISEHIDAIPVVTTATDVNGIFAVDEWAKRQNCVIPDPGKIKSISARLLAGGTVTPRTLWPVLGNPPSGVVVAQADGEYDFCTYDQTQRARRTSDCSAHRCAGSWSQRGDIPGGNRGGVQRSAG